MQIPGARSICASSLRGADFRVTVTWGSRRTWSSPARTRAATFRRMPATGSQEDREAKRQPGPRTKDARVSRASSRRGCGSPDGGGGSSRSSLADPRQPSLPGHSIQPSKRLGQLSAPRPGPLEEHGEVLGEQHALVEDDLAARDAPLTVNLAQQVLTLADEEIRLGLDAVAVDEKAALDADLPRRKAGRARLQELHVRDHVTDPGWRLLCPVDAGEDLLDAAAKGVLALVEPVDVRARARELSLQLVPRHVAAHGHEVVRILGEEIEPLLVAALVEELRLPVEELLDLLLEEESREVGRLEAHRATSSVQLEASMNCRQRR